MTGSSEQTESHPIIQRRLYRCLLFAFVIVVSLTAVLLVSLFVGLAGLLTRGDNGDNSLEAHELEAYYLGHNSWDGVGAILTQSMSGGPLGPNAVQWSDVTLLDTAGRIVVDAGHADGARIVSRIE